MLAQFETGRKLAVHRMAVRPEWIDYNGHMNVAYYLLAFDQAADAFFDLMGFDEAYRRRTGFSTFAMEAHICYLREVKAGDPLRFEIRMLDLDAKRFHYLNTMVHDTAGFVAATCEWISTGMDMTARKTAAMPAEVHARFAALLDAQRALPVPPQVGRTIGIRRKG
jgi:acyl-CoA thioester hydrolase